MTQLEDLPPDQRAVLSLLLRQGKPYAEIAALLDIEERAVRDRAQAALAVLAPRQARELTAELRQQIGDYLLGQQDAPSRTETYGMLEISRPAQAWAQAVAAELAPLSPRGLPKLPGGGAAGGGFAGGSVRAGSSRLGGALLLGGIAVVLVVAVVLILSSGGGSGSKQAAATSTSTGTSTSTATTTTATPHEDARISLTATDQASAAKGTALVLSEGSKRAFYVAITGLSAAPSGSFYAVWLTGTSVKAEPIGVLPAPGSKGQIEGGSLLPSDPGRFHRMIVTSETSKHPTHPGTVLLGGTFTIGK